MSTAVSPIFTEQALSVPLPIPKGPYLLVEMLKTPEKIGSLHLPDSRVKDENLAAPIGTVIAMGPEAYLPSEKFPGGPRCAVGDIVFMGAYVGSKLKAGPDVTDAEYRLIFDDDVKAVIPASATVRRDM